MAVASRRPPRKQPDRYHHGDLRRALIRAALRTIQQAGVDAVTLRGVGEDLGVSRTALYRHFADKAALLAAVGAEGFRTFRHELQLAWDGAGGGWAGFEAMGQRYVRFAIENPSYYRVMFGAFRTRSAGSPSPDPELAREAAAAFEQLVGSIRQMQAAGIVRDDDPLMLARHIWASVHGVAMLAIDGRLPPGTADTLARFTVTRIGTGIATKVQRGSHKGHEGHEAL
jgi:AcrR family transcriptional regulator